MQLYEIAQRNPLTLYSGSITGGILHNYGTISQPGNGH